MDFGRIQAKHRSLGNSVSTIRYLGYGRWAVSKERCDMAKEIIGADRIDHTLWLGTAMLEELADISQEWDEIPDWEQADWSLEWEQFLSFLRHDLEAAYKSSQMTSQQKAQYKKLLANLKDVAPILKKLNLSQPPLLAERPQA